MDILISAYQGGVAVDDPQNFEILAAISNTSVKTVRDFARGVTQRETFDDLALPDSEEPAKDMTLPELFEEKKKLRTRLQKIESMIRKQKKRQSYFDSKHRVKRQKLEEYLADDCPKVNDDESKPKRSSHLVRVRLYCAHCQSYFYAKPTKRVNLHVLNHQCSGEKRKQFVVGRHHRRCTFDHPPEVPCIDFAPKPKEEPKDDS